MKTLLIIGIILAILTVYFVLNTEKSFSVKGVKGNESAIPAGIDVAKFILNKVKDIIPKITSDIDDIKDKKLNYIFKSDMTDVIKSRIGDIKSKILEESSSLIKDPIKNKIDETFCPQN